MRRENIASWLRKKASNLDIGEKWKGKPIHLNTNEMVKAHFSKLQRGLRSWLNRLTNADIYQHIAGVKTLYFAGNGSKKEPDTLVMIDIDCHEYGTKDGAEQYALHLRKAFPDLYCEESTNGNGVHGYFVLDKETNHPQYINSLLSRLEQCLQSKLSKEKYEIENVEIKGRCPVITWGKERLEVETYKSGTLAKLPRLATKSDEIKLRNTTRIHHSKLRQMIERMEAEQTLCSKVQKVVKLPSSISGKLIDKKELNKLNTHYLSVAKKLMKRHGEIAVAGESRAIVTEQDVAIFLMIGKYFTNNMNEDGSLPTKRWKAMWTALFEAGDVTRAFQDRRFAAIRNMMSKLGIIDWNDNTYEIGKYDMFGNYHSGRACKWQFSEELMQMLDNNTSFAVTQTPDHDTHWLQPVQIIKLEPVLPSIDKIMSMIKPYEPQFAISA